MYSSGTLFIRIGFGLDYESLLILLVSFKCDVIILTYASFSFAIRIASLTEYRNRLHEYIKDRMLACAPSLSTLVGEQVLFFFKSLSCCVATSCRFYVVNDVKGQNTRLKIECGGLKIYSNYFRSELASSRVLDLSPIWLSIRPPLSRFLALRRLCSVL